MAGEAKLEDRCRNWAKPVISYRYQFMGVKGGMDCVFFCHKAPVLWIEFKNPNKKGNVSASQQLIHSMLKGAGHEIHVIDDFKQFRETWDEHHRKSRS